MKISMIAAMDRNNAIGADGGIPWYLPEDLKSFKALTLGKVIIMGRKTWESIGAKPLRDRKTIIISTDPKGVLNIEIPYSNGVIATPSIPLALNAAEAMIKQGGYPEEVMVIGGAVIYHQFINIADTLYLSHVDTTVVKADAFFPVINRDEWAVNYSQTHPAGENNSLRWTYQVLNRIGGK